MSDKTIKTERAAAMKPVLRVVRYMLHYYKYPFMLVVACILIGAVATVIGATFPQKLVDEYILPMLAEGSSDFSGLKTDLIQLACVMEWALSPHFPTTGLWLMSARARC